MAAAAAPTEGGAARSQKQKICGCGKKWCGQNEVVSDQSGSLCWDYSDVVAGANASCFTVGFGAHVMADPNTPRDSTSSGDFAGKRYTSVCFKLPGAVAARRFAKALAANRPIQVGEAVDVVLSPPTKRQNGKSTATKAPKRTKRVPGVVCAVFGDVVEVDVADGGGRKQKHKQVQAANVFRRSGLDLATQLRDAGLLDWTNVPKGNFPIQESDLAADGSQLHTLLRTVDYFTTWRAKLRTSGLCAKEMECSFITREQWEDVQWNCLGMVSLCHYYLTGHPERRIVGRRLQTDVIEHHFANRRQQRGTNAKGQVAALNAADAAASACREVSFVSSKANCSKRKDHADRDPYGDPVHISVSGMEGRRKSRRRLDNHHLTLDAKVDPDWYRQAPTTDQPMT
eukprot:m.221561 g.221561  ORF g.221561 m.221561 type:complete len:399 (+) comp25803_c0_seq12:54-1250(+)